MADPILATKKVLLRLSETQKQQLTDDAQKAGMTQQAYVEMKLFGELRPRGAYGQRPYLRPDAEDQPAMIPAEGLRPTG